MGPGTQYPSISVTHLQQPANLTTLLRPGREEVRYEKIKGNCSCVSVPVALCDQMPLGALTHVELCLLPMSETRALGTFPGVCAPVKVLVPKRLWLHYSSLVAFNPSSLCRLFKRTVERKTLKGRPSPPRYGRQNTITLPLCHSRHDIHNRDQSAAT